MLMDGPLEGHVHQVEPGGSVPELLRERDPAEPTRLHFYRVLGDEGGYRAFYDCSEFNPLPPSA
jgi:hypothetical protein